MSIPEPPKYSKAKVAVNNYLQREDLHAKWLKSVVIFWPIGEDTLARYIKASRELPVAYETCIKLIERFTENNQPIPRQLAAWIRDIAYGHITRPASPGRSKYDNSNRDAVIREAMRIAVKHGLKPLRNKTAPPYSGCDLVSECLKDFKIHRAYSGIAEIWKNRR